MDEAITVDYVFSLAMKKPVAVFLFLLFSGTLFAQKIQMIVPVQPVVAQTAFLVQYIITAPSDLVNFTQPDFKDIQLISGPHHYKGNAVIDGKMQSIENITYTLVCSRTGKIKINGLTARFKNGEVQRTNEAYITVLPLPNASFTASSSYTDISLYDPSSKTDIEKLIKENLFIKAQADRTTCYIGEPLVITFKLYSRLQSTSEVLNAPALYGFSVMDILDINEAHQAVETINGKVFNTSTLRKLQLYPEQSGRLLIDAMQLQNEIEFDNALGKNKTKIQKELASKPIAIMVKPLPEKKPGNYTGAVGQFIIDAHFDKDELPVSQQGKLIVTISGRGNFIQFDAPAISWPKGFDASDPFIKDEINKTNVPTQGKRIYEYGFTVDNMGQYVLPPIMFSFFNAKTNSFKTVSTESLNMLVTEAEKNIPDTIQKTPQSSFPLLWIFPAGIFIGVFLVFKIRYDKKRKIILPPVNSKPGFIQRISEVSNELTEKQTCIKLQKIIVDVLEEKDLTAQQKQELELIKKDCELIIYSDINVHGKIENLESRTLKILKEMEH